MAATRYPGALWKPLPSTSYSTGVTRPPRGMVLHIAEGTSIDGIWNWQANPKAQVSSYFIIGKDGTVWQGVDLDAKAWTQSAGNGDWIGVENAGYHTEALTAAQVEANARLLAWLHTEHGVPLQLADAPDGHGLGWHGMGGTAWGGHFGCPGDQIKAQRTQILDRARTLTGGTPTPSPTPVPPSENSMLLVRGDKQPAVYRVRADRTAKVWIPNPAILTIDQTVNGQLGFEKTVIVWAQGYVDTIPIVGPRPNAYTGV